jgi:hypothetical protein
MAVLHPVGRGEPGAALAVVEGLGALVVLIALVAGLSSLFAWALVQVVLLLAG